MSRIASIQRRSITTERLFNLAVDRDESFVANGIVVHNCKSFIIPIAKGNLGDREITKLSPSTKAIADQVQFSDDEKS